MGNQVGPEPSSFGFPTAALLLTCEVENEKVNTSISKLSVVQEFIPERETNYNR